VLRSSPLERFLPVPTWRANRRAIYHPCDTVVRVCPSIARLDCQVPTGVTISSHRVEGTTMAKQHPVHALRANLEAARVKAVEELAATNGPYPPDALQQLASQSRHMAQRWDGARAKVWTSCTALRLRGDGVDIRRYYDVWSSRVLSDSAREAEPAFARPSQPVRRREFDRCGSHGWRTLARTERSGSRSDRRHRWVG
jgi:hypothetical protein